MNKTNKLILAIVVILVLIGAAIILFKPEKSNAPGMEGTDSQNSAAQSDDQPVAATIIYDGQTFSASTNSVASGDSVKVVNNSDKQLDFDSDPHPVHTDNPELNAGAIPPRQSKVFTLTAKGTWGYHNHLNASQKGQIEVK